MEKIIYNNDQKILDRFSDFNVMFIDIETDGLSHKNKIVILGLIIYVKHKNKPIVIQLFNDDYQSEKEMLVELTQLISKYSIDYYVSFNGNSFDFPFINARLAHYKINAVLLKAANIDLYRLVKQNQEFLNLTDSKLKTVEKFVGIDRTDTISGKDSIILYEAYLESQSEILKKSILLHNYDDIVNMIPLIKILDSIDFIAPYYFEYHGYKFYLSSFKMKGNYLHCKLTVNCLYSLRDLYYNFLGATFEFSGLELNLRLELQTFSDHKGNVFMFMNSNLIYEKNFSLCDDAEKHGILATYNGSYNDLSINNYVKVAVIKILNLLDFTKSND